MKGIVFTEFLEMVENTFGLETCDQLIESSDLDSDGIYTSVGTYDPQELLTMVSKLSELQSIPVPELVKAFGTYLYGVFKKGFPMFFEGQANALEFLRQVHSVIHVEVKKLYPDAELPEFSYRDVDGGLDMNYRSKMGLADLAEGLIEASLADDSQAYSLERVDGCDGEYATAMFHIRLNG